MPKESDYGPRPRIVLEQGPDTPPDDENLPLFLTIDRIRNEALAPGKVWQEQVLSRAIDKFLQVKKNHPAGLEALLKDPILQRELLHNQNALAVSTPKSIADLAVAYVYSTNQAKFSLVDRNAVLEAYHNPSTEGGELKQAQQILADSRRQIDEIIAALNKALTDVAPGHPQRRSFLTETLSTLVVAKRVDELMAQRTARLFVEHITEIIRKTSVADTVPLLIATVGQQALVAAGVIQRDLFRPSSPAFDPTIRLGTESVVERTGISLDQWLHQHQNGLAWQPLGLDIKGRPAMADDGVRTWIREIIAKDKNELLAVTNWEATIHLLKEVARESRGRKLTQSDEFQRSAAEQYREMFTGADAEIAIARLLRTKWMPELANMFE